jgi:ribosomal protein S18 acetylase RimI-like enzyme
MWLIRKATLKDREKVRELCVSAVGHDDYVIFMLDGLIRRAATMIALDEGKVIGMMAYHRQMDGSAWISSARTHPDYRRRGVATSIMRSCEDLAKEHGDGPLRLWTESNNESGKAAFAKVGFREVGRFTRMSAPPTNPGPVEDFGPLGYSERLWNAVRSSQILSRSNFYLDHGFGFLKVTRGLFKTLVDRGFVYGWGRNVAVMSEFMFAGMETLEAQILLDDPRETLRDLPAIAGANNMEQVHTFLPHEAELIRAARNAGFELIDWGMEAILCEKEITPTRESELKQR